MATITRPFLGRAAADRNVGFERRPKVGRSISELREAKGLTQEELGRELGVRNTYVSAIELGRTSISPERYSQFAEALGARPREFGKHILRHYNPWLYAMLYDDANVKDTLAFIPDRLQDLREQS